MKNINILFFIILCPLLLSCATSFDRKNPYPNMNVVTFQNGKGYEFKNKTSKKLLVILEGSTLDSVLGNKRGNSWKWTGITAQIIQVLNDKYTILTLEKFMREPGYDYYKNVDINDRTLYTFENLINCYKTNLNEYLSKNNYESVIVLGQSEGAIVLPFFYLQLNNENIKPQRRIHFAYGEVRRTKAPFYTLFPSFVRL